MRERQNSKAMADLATRFVNLKDRNSVRGFIRDHALDIREFPLIGSAGVEPTAAERLENTISLLVDIIRNFRSGWTGETYGGLMDMEWTAESILYGVRQVPLGGRIMQVDRSSVEAADVWARPAVELVPYKKSRKSVNFFFRFKRRDVLDEIAYAVLIASKRGLLRFCKGRKEHPEWDCQMPYLVANEARTRYCYGACGERNQAELVRNWRAGQRSKKINRKTKRCGDVACKDTF
jgi:hypothetical protein